MRRPSVIAGLVALALVGGGSVGIGAAGDAAGESPDSTRAATAAGRAGVCRPARTAYIGGTTLAAIDAVSHTRVWSGGEWRLGKQWTPSMMLWNGDDWELGPTPAPGTDFDGVRGISAIGPNDVWAVGVRDSGAAVDPLAIHWNGRAWSSVPVPSPHSEYDSLQAVDAVASGDVWAAGYASSGGAMRSLVVHWNGHQWSGVPTPSFGSTEDNMLLGISARTGGNVWAVGRAGRAGLVLHKVPGKPWKRLPVPSAGFGTELRDVLAFSSTNVWVVGTSWVGGFTEDVLLHWNGNAWSRPQHTVTGELNALDGRGASDVWAAGGGDPNSGGEMVLLHFNGSSWSASNSPGYGGPIMDLSEVAPNDVWVAGTGYLAHSCGTAAGRAATAGAPAPAGAAVAPAAVCDRQEPVDAALLPRTMLPGGCSLTGLRVTDHGVTLAIPPPGHGVSATADTTAGGQTLSAETAGDGTVRLRNVGSETPAETGAGAGAGCADCIPPCEVPDFTFIITPVWKGPVRWSMNTARTPRPLSPAQGLATTKKSAVDIAAGANDCGLHDVTGLTTPFQGTTAKRASIDPNSESCLPKGDGVNVVEWGQLGTSPFGTTLGLTCVRWLVGAVPLGIDEFDMRLNDDDGLFTLTPGTQCSADIDLQGVTTHEWGHAVGLNHVGQGAETMFPTIEWCDASRRTLALGEILALRLAY